MLSEEPMRAPHPSRTPALALAAALLCPSIAHTQRVPPPARDAGLAHDPPRGPGDALPEPRAPQTECAYERTVRCQAPSPVRSAHQPAPFEACPPQLAPAPAPHAVHASAALFSPRETRAAWRAGRHECCYVQFVATACD